MKIKQFIWASPLLILSFALTGCLGRGAAPPPKPTPTPVHIALADKRPQPNPAFEPAAAHLIAARLLLGKGASLLQAAADARDQGLDASALADVRDAFRDYLAARAAFNASNPPTAFADAFDILNQAIQAYADAMHDISAQRKGTAAALARLTAALHGADRALHARPETALPSVHDQATVVAARSLAATRVVTVSARSRHTPAHRRPAAHTAPQPTPTSIPVHTTVAAAPTPTATPNPAVAAAYMLAILQHHGPLPYTSPLVVRFQRDLSLLAGKCVEQESALAAAIQNAHDTLRGVGLHLSYLAALDGVFPYVNTAPARMPCAPLIAAYVANREQAFHPTPVVIAMPNPPAPTHANPPAPAHANPPLASRPAPPSDNPQSVADARAAAQATTLALAHGPVIRSVPTAHLLDRLQTIQSQFHTTVTLLQSYQATTDPRLPAQIDSNRTLLAAEIHAAAARLTWLQSHRQAAGAAPAIHRAISAYRRALRALAAAENDVAIGAHAHFPEDLDAVTAPEHTADAVLDQLASHITS